MLLGSQGDAEITADEWAERLGTINYEIVCGFGPRMPRRYHG
jgi:alanine racemase